MKIYKYYKVPDKDSVDKTYDLYAVTNDKKLAMRFEEERRMKKFVKGEVTDIDSEDYIKFANNNREAVLGPSIFQTKYVGENGIYQTISVEVLTTNGEYMDCAHEYTEELLFDQSLFDRLPYYKVFNNKLLKNLKKLEFVPMFKIMRNHMPDGEAFDDYTAPDFEVDEFAIFIRCFNSILK